MDKYDHILFTAPKFYSWHPSAILITTTLCQGQSCSRKVEFAQRICRRNYRHFMTKMKPQGESVFLRIHALEMNNGSTNFMPISVKCLFWTRLIWLSRFRANRLNLGLSKSMLFMDLSMQRWVNSKKRGIYRGFGWRNGYTPERKSFGLRLKATSLWTTSLMRLGYGCTSFLVEFLLTST